MGPPPPARLIDLPCCVNCVCLLPVWPLQLFVDSFPPPTPPPPPTPSLMDYPPPNPQFNGLSPPTPSLMDYPPPHPQFNGLSMFHQPLSLCFCVTLWWGSLVFIYSHSIATAASVTVSISWCFPLSSLCVESTPISSPLHFRSSVSLIGRGLDCTFSFHLLFMQTPVNDDDIFYIFFIWMSFPHWVWYVSFAILLMQRLSSSCDNCSRKHFSALQCLPSQLHDCWHRV